MIARNDISFLRRRSADNIVRSARNSDAIATVWYRYITRDISADEVADNSILTGSWTSYPNSNAITTCIIARNQVVLNQVFRRIADDDANIVADRNSTSNISANAIADYLVVARSDAGNLDAGAGNTGKNSGLAED